MRIRHALIKNGLVIFIYALFVSACWGQSQIDDDEYVIYTSLIQQAIRPAPSKSLVIWKTIKGDLIGQESSRLIRELALDKYLVSDFNRRNTEAASLENKFNLDVNVLVLDTEVKRLFASFGEQAETDWANFRKQYNTGAVVILSRPGFNRIRDRALLVAGSQSGWLGGEGHYYLFERKGDKWKIKRRVRAWIS